MPYLRHSSCKSINFADKAVVNFNLLLPHTVLALGSFVNNDFLNQCIQKFSGQFSGIGILLDKVNPLFGVVGSFLLSGKFSGESVNFLYKLLLLGLVLLRQHIEVVLRDAFRKPALIHLGEQPVHLCLAFLREGLDRYDPLCFLDYKQDCVLAMLECLQSYDLERVRTF